MLKVSAHVAETRTEIEALRLWNGNGAARLIRNDPELGALLMERVEPGSLLAEIADDLTTVRVTADVLRKLWIAPPQQHELRSLESWCAAYDRNRAAVLRGTRGFPIDLFKHADDLRAELLATGRQPVIVHGDMHHFNVLRSGRVEWLAIDPKGLVGDPHFDLCQFLRNPVPVPPEVSRRRLDVFSDLLGLDRRRASQWNVVHAVLNALWAFEDGSDWRRETRTAEDALAY